MAKSPIRKSIEHLIKRVETLENQSFGQKLLIDELEGKLQQAENTVKELKENPFGIKPLNLPAVSIPSMWPAPPLLHHVCTPGPTDWTGGTHCIQCGAQISGPTWTITSTSDSTQIALGDPASQSSSDVEPILDLDISWVIPDEPK